MGAVCSCNKNNIDYNDNIFQTPVIRIQEEVEVKAKSGKGLSPAADFIFEDVKEVAEPKEAGEGNHDEQLLKDSFLSKCDVINQICGQHFMDPLYSSILSLENIGSRIQEGKPLIFRDKKAKKKLKYFKENLLLSLKKNQDFINLYLKYLFNDNLDKKQAAKEDFFRILIDDDNKSVNSENSEISGTEKNQIESEEEITKVNLIGFNKKKNFFHNFLLNNKNSNEYIPKNKQKNSIFIINMNKDLLKSNILLGVQIVENGKLYAGKFNKEGNLEGKGVYIDKKGSLFLGEFVKGELLFATVYGLDESIYEGRILRMRKHGLNQIENTLKYEFTGDYENGKKVKGFFCPKDTENCVKQIEIDSENVKNLKKLTYTRNVDFVAKYTIKFGGKHKNQTDADRIAFYTGKVINSKLNDTNAFLQFDSRNTYPFYQGDIRDNIKEGFGTYYWNEKDFYSGNFSDNILNKNSKKVKSLGDINNKNILTNYGRTFEVTCEKGKVVKFKEI